MLEWIKWLWSKLANGKGERYHSRMDFQAVNQGFKQLGEQQQKQIDQLLSRVSTLEAHREECEKELAAERRRMETFERNMLNKLELLEAQIATARKKIAQLEAEGDDIANDI